MANRRDNPDLDEEGPLMRTTIAPTEARENILQDKEIITQEKISYLWKVFKFKGKTIGEAVDSHPYVKDPHKNITHEFFMFHLVR